MSLYKYEPLESHKDNDCSDTKRFNDKEIFQSKKEHYKRESYERAPYQRESKHRESYQRQSYQREPYQRESINRKQFKDNYKKQYTNEKDFLRKLDEEADESFKNSRRESDFTSKNAIHPQKSHSTKKEEELKDQLLKKSFELQKHQQVFIETESNEIRSQKSVTPPDSFLLPSEKENKTNLKSFLENTEQTIAD